MTSSQFNLRGLVVYATILPLAIFLGYLLSNPLSQSSFMWMAIVFLVLVTPLILRWHHPLLFLSWNMTAVLFVPGSPQLWLVMAFVSLTISLLQYALARNVHFGKTRSILYPLLFIGAVVLVTAQLTGGVGLKMMGSEQIGGKLYLYILAGVAGYLAMTAHPIAASKANLYLGLFLLGALTNAIGNLVAYLPSQFYIIFHVFPVERQGVAAVMNRTAVTATETITRFYGLSLALMGMAYFLMAKNGLASLLNLRKPASWFFVLAIVSSTLGGYRSFLILSLLTVGLVFLLEGLHRSRQMPAIAIMLILGAVIVVGFSDRMPFSIQRSLSFLPIRVDPAVTLDAKGSSEWRIELWRDLLPMVPDHLLLGKGLSINRDQLDTVTSLENQGRASTAESAILAGDYHSGPLSVIIPFGIWGAIGWIWLMVAGIRALYLNYRNSPPELRSANRFLFAYFLAKVLLFHAVFGSFHSDFAPFAGLLGLSIALNNGIRKPASVVESPKKALHGALSRPRLIPAFSQLGQR
jgi:hypothetical protein